MSLAERHSKVMGDGATRFPAAPRRLDGTTMLPPSDGVKDDARTLVCVRSRSGMSRVSLGSGVVAHRAPFALPIVVQRLPHRHHRAATMPAPLRLRLRARARDTIAFGAALLPSLPASPAEASASAAARLPAIWEADPWHLAASLALALVVASLLTAFALEHRNRRRADAELLGTEQLLRMAADAAGVGLWMRDLRRDRPWANDAHRAIFALAPEDVPDLPKRLDLVHPDDRTAVAAAIEAARERGGEYAVRHRIVRGDGELRWVASHGSVRLDGRGKPTSMWGVTSDITTPVRAELDAEVNRNELAHLSRVAMLGQLSGSIAHELNQPLTAILSNAQAALRFTSATPVDLETLREILRDIVADDQRAGEIIWRLRALFERGESKSEPIVTGTLVRDVVRMLRSELISRNVSVTVELDPALPAMQGDPVQLQQVLLNLIYNACEAMANSERWARWLVVRATADESEVAISVVDGGPGIAPERLEKIFEPFVSSKPLGIGLGLVISRSIVTAHGGRLWCRNNDVRGATFTFTIPRAPTAAPPAAERSPATGLVAIKEI
jgi:PAS domain S-box-containing protein